MNLVPLYIGALVALLIAAAVWRYRQRDMLGMVACLIMAGLGAWLCVS